MKFLKYELSASEGDVVVVELDHAANVQLLDVANFSRYRRGQSYRYVGGFYRQSPVRLSVPSDGHWYVVIDLGGHRGTVRASVGLVT